MSKKLYIFLAVLMALSMVSCAAPAPAPTAAPAPAAAAPTAVPAPTEAPAPTAAPAAAPTTAPAAAPTAATAGGASLNPDVNIPQPTDNSAGLVADKGSIKELNLIWAQWDPANYLAELVKDYEKDEGVKINIIQEPWGSYADRVSAEWAAKGNAFDMLIGDSQWTGQGAIQGHYVELTNFLKENNILNTVTAATLKYYGEYPPNSGRYWGYPTEGDALGYAYRTDLFTDPKEMSGFKAKYGYELAVPKTYKEMRDIAEWFYRPNANPPLYGVAVYTQKDYDAITMGVESTLFSYGMEWQDKNFNVMGVVNSPHAVEALQMYKDLYNFGPPGNNNSFYPEMNNYFTSGQVAMAMNYFAFLPALANKGTNPLVDKTAFFANPAGPYGDRFASLGGQGLNVNAHNSKERIQASLAFVKWFAQDSVQAKWAQLGGYSCNIKALESPEFLKIAPYNAAFADTMKMVKDFWNIPEYGTLLASAQKYLHAFIVGNEGTAQQAMDGIAKENDATLREAGYIK